MQFSAVEARFIVTTYLYSTFANDLKRKYFFSKNVHSYRVCSFNNFTLKIYVYCTYVNYLSMDAQPSMSPRPPDKSA